MNAFLEKRLSIAIIGAGISGLGIAHLLSPYHNIKIYEKNDYIGGHGRTSDINTQERTFEIHFPKKFTLFLKFIRILPYGLSTKILKRIKQ